MAAFVILLCALTALTIVGISATPIRSNCGNRVNFRTTANSTFQLERCQRVSYDVPTSISLVQSYLANRCSYIVHGFSNTFCDDDKKVLSIVLNSRNQIAQVNSRNPVCSFRLKEAQSQRTTVSFWNAANKSQNFTLRTTTCRNLCKTQTEVYNPVRFSVHRNVANSAAMPVDTSSVQLFTERDCDDDTIINFSSQIGHQQNLPEFTRTGPMIKSFTVVAI